MVIYLFDFYSIRCTTDEFGTRFSLVPALSLAAWGGRILSNTEHREDRITLESKYVGRDYTFIIHSGLIKQLYSPTMLTD